jgi:hypothetical protein
MAMYIETLESRSLLSAAVPLTGANPSDVLAEDQRRVGAAVQQFISHAQECGGVLSGALQALGADLQRLAATPRGQALADRLRTDVETYSGILGDNVNDVITAGSAAGGAVLQGIVNLFLHRNDPAQVRLDRDQLATDLRRLRRDTAPAVAALRSSLSSAARTLSRDLREIATYLDGDTAFRSRRETLSTQLGTCARTLRADLRTLAADVQTLMRHQRQFG